jgi:chromosome transmission fidelity protein 18
MKEVLAQRAAHERMRAREQESVEATAKAAASKVSSKPSAVTSQDENIPHSSKKRAGQAEKETALPPAKRPKASMTAQNFLGIGAKKAKEARSARTAARVGVNRSQKNKASHTGSGVPFPQVIRLKYVKGFTQAVRTPCRLEDLQ